MQNNHEQLISGILKQQQKIFNGSAQAMYIYMDDMHKACNKKFSSMLGYNSPAEWKKVNEPFPLAFVAEKSRSPLIHAYRDAMENGIGSQVKVSWKKKQGGTVATTVILVPIAYEGHLIALHFISK